MRKYYISYFFGSVYNKLENRFYSKIEYINGNMTEEKINAIQKNLEDDHDCDNLTYITIISWKKLN